MRGQLKFQFLIVCSREPFIILSGGLSYDTVGRRPCLTVMHGKSTAVLEMDYPIVDFLTLCETPYPNGNGFVWMCSCTNTHTLLCFLIMLDCLPLCWYVSVINLKFPKGKDPISVSLSSTWNITFPFHPFVHNSFLSKWSYFLVRILQLNQVRVELDGVGSFMYLVHVCKLSYGGGGYKLCNIGDLILWPPADFIW